MHNTHTLQALPRTTSTTAQAVAALRFKPTSAVSSNHRRPTLCANDRYIFSVRKRPNNSYADSAIPNPIVEAMEIGDTGGASPRRVLLLVPLLYTTSFNYRSSHLLPYVHRELAQNQYPKAQCRREAGVRPQIICRHPYVREKQVAFFRERNALYDPTFTPPRMSFLHLRRS